MKYPLSWRLLDGLEAAAAVLWPARLRRLTAWGLLAPALVLVGVLVIGLGYMLEYSLHELDLATYRLTEAYSLTNYQTILDRPVYARVLGRTLLGAVLVTAIAVALAFPYAYALVRTRSAALRKALLVALFLPFFIGQVVRAYGWLIVLGREGLVNSALAGMGLPTVDLLFTYPAVIFGLVQYMLPFAILLLVPALAAIPEDMELASESLGARWISTFRHVVIPMAKPGLIGASVVVFTLTLTDFAMPEILGGGTSDFIASAIYDSFFQISNPGLGAALSMVLVTLGSLIVAGVFLVAGTGTLGVRGAK
ncbi:ABC transporter permease [Rhodovulum euryhalinum]|uniref:Putative spermidine/putrescine transport system permease protein n=1 Tax=Rhodovulum euryhalinum TaxID=35805 RepID=A0A4R2KK71_9RHOB|nr:ABC transporter permease [Rhodovulum euryhalinum]TCO74053.1 putative spermidine/putrescine transport system permease protein [Rhodovulum euryhalinum]